MTEIIDRTEEIPEAMARFILHWGDLGNQWGVNRSVAQIQALLYLSERPITAEEIAETLGLARSNVSNSIKELLAWKLIQRTPVMGDRRDHYEAITDIWEMVTRIVQGRKERELDPAANALRDCIEAAKSDKKISPVALRRLQEMQEFVETTNRWYDQMLTVPKANLIALIKMGTKVTGLLSGRKRKDG
ncbi:MAG: ArsR family transcriptional regulator [Rhodospirillaceae bacterium]|nr:ArsR family transcriptional regulator [Rhodospirillaceae bacterium]|tara:strand:- start:9096 stop:9662 length:567 start_codon:yes stop_codon:yes gene_type:complete